MPGTDRQRIDPDGRYPADPPRRAECFALLVLDHLRGAALERTRDVIQIDGGGDQGIVVVITPDDLELRMPTTEWTGGAYGPAPSSTLWKRIGLDDLDGADLPGLLDAAIAHRAGEFVACRHCGQLFPPEHRHDDVCHGCSEKHLGIVH